MKSLLQKLRLISAAVAGHFDRRDYQPVTFCNIKALLMHLCDFDEELCLWVMRWLAYPLRNPGAKMGRALVVNGEKDSGKSLFFNGVAVRLYELGHGRVIHDAQLHAAYNEWATAPFVVVDGTFSKPHAARLKELVVADAILVERKGQRARRRKNRTNFVFLSSSTEFLPVIETDRRLCVMEVPPRREAMLYRAAAYEMENGGVEAFRDFLMRDLDMGDFDEQTQPPMHRAGRAVLEAA